jgi:hypothetical protein
MAGAYSPFICGEQETILCGLRAEMVRSDFQGGAGEEDENDLGRFRGGCYFSTFYFLVDLGL